MILPSDCNAAASVLPLHVLGGDFVTTRPALPKDGSSVLSHEFALLCFDSLAKIESAVAVQTNGFACSL